MGVNVPTTMAVRLLREHDVEFTPHLYRYQGGGAAASAEVLKVDPMTVAKTIILEDERAAPLCVVMNGPFEVGTKQLARHLGCKRVEPCSERRAELLTGYRVGGISPFGQRTEIPVFVQLDLYDYASVLVNGGQRGFLVELAPAVIERTLGADVVDIAVR